MIDSSFHSSGTFSKQAHVKIPEGLYEEEHGRKGFFGRVSHLYHEKKLTSWSNIEGDLKPRCVLSLFAQPEFQENFAPILYNHDVILSYGTFSKGWNFFWRNGDFVSSPSRLITTVCDFALCSLPWAASGTKIMV